MECKSSQTQSFFLEASGLVCSARGAAAWSQGPTAEGWTDLLGGWLLAFTDFLSLQKYVAGLEGPSLIIYGCAYGILRSALFSRSALSKHFAAYASLQNKADNVSSLPWGTWR